MQNREIYGHINPTSEQKNHILCFIAANKSQIKLFTMAVPQLLASFLDKNGDTLQQMALLAYLREGDEAKPFLEAITAAKVRIS